MTLLPTRPVLRTIVLLVLIGVVLYLARLAVGLSSAAVHYANTPKFETFISEVPVSEETIAQAFNEAELVSENGRFFAGNLDPAALQPDGGDLVRTSRTVEIILDHGPDSLLRFSQTFSQAVDRESWVPHGFSVEAPTIETHPGMRVVSDARVFDLDKMFDPAQPGRGGIILNVVLAAGQGPNLSRVTSGEYDSVTQVGESGFEWNPLSRGPRLSFPWWRAATGITHNLQDLPEEGLIHQFQLVVRFDRIKVPGGSQGPSSHFPRHAVTTEEYSYSWKVTQQDDENGNPGGSATSSKSTNRTWRNATW